MSKQKEVECIDRLLTMGLMVDEMMDFFLEEKVMDPANMAAFRLARDKALYIYDLVKKAKLNDKVSLFDYEWVILPVERIKITAVTERNSKEFIYNAQK